MGAVVADVEPRGGGSESVGKLFQGSDTGGVVVWGGDVGTNTQHGAVLSSFQHRVTRRLTGGQPRRRGDRSWEYPQLEEAMAEAGFEGIGTYIKRRQNMISQYIATQPILDLCERSDRRPMARVSQRWWEQEGLDLEGAKKRTEAAAESDREETIGKEEGIPL